MKAKQIILLLIIALLMTSCQGAAMFMLDTIATIVGIFIAIAIVIMILIAIASTFKNK